MGLTEFIIAMHLLASYKNGSMRALPQILPPGLYEAAARRGVPRQMTGSRPTSDGAAASAIPRQFTGSGFSSQPASPARATFQQATPTGDGWAVTAQDKAQFDQIYAGLDTQNRGAITGEQAVQFFSNSRLPEEALAQIWDLADINSQGRLTRDEFAVAMYLIRQQRSKRDGRDVLPQSLPPNLIPPSMRRQPIAPQQPTAPAFDNAANISQPKSASEDLFGLDAFSSSPPPAAAPTQPKDIGNSAYIAPSPREEVLPAPQQKQSQQQQALHFKPFIPSSTFGQTMMTPQGTGTSSTASPTSQDRGLPQQQKQLTAMDDLLGDNDPEVSKRLTSETSELANLSNQVSTLSGQMQEVKTKRDSTEQNLSQAQAQKRDFEGRLGQLRSAYEQEVREVHALEERLTASRNETRKLQQDMALIEGTHQDLQNQHRQMGEALNTDQNENAALKHRISQSNAQIAEMKPQSEKMRSDARQQKGLVAINKKQLATNEAELEKIKAELAESAREHEEAKRELEQSQRDLEAASQAVSQARSPPSAVPAAVASPPAQIASPTPSVASMNPFFRQTSNAAGTERGNTSSFTSQSVASPNHNAFDSFFGPPQGQPSGPPPSTSFRRSETPTNSRELPTQMTGSTDGPGIQTPSASPPPSNFSDSPQVRNEPPAPPQSRQITSSFLPLRPQAVRADSETSSTRANPPRSRVGGFETPTERPATSTESPIPESPKQHFEEAARASQSEPRQITPSSSQYTPSASTEGLRQQEATVPHPLHTSSGLPSAAAEIPGAFPGADTPPGESPSVYQDATTGPYGSSKLDPRVDSTSRDSADMASTSGNDPFAMSGNERHSPMAAKDDFDSAFAGFGSDDREAPEHTNGVTSNGFSSEAPKPQREFPPIQELEADDESDSDDDHGFDDHFTAASANRTIESGPNQALQNLPVSNEGGLAPVRPPFNTVDSDRSQLPTPGAQASPPTYDSTMGSEAPGHRKESNQFPAEYSGLLPSRNDPTSPIISPPPQSNNVASAAGIDRGLNFFGNDTPEHAAGHATFGSSFTQDHSPMSPGASTAAPYAYTQSPPQIQQPQAQAFAPAVPPKAPADEFDAEFADLDEAKEAEDEGDPDIGSSGRTDFDDFNPVFDSPSASRHTAQSTASTFGPSESFSDFGSSQTNVGVGMGASSQQKAPQETPSHDWDAIFAGLDTPQNNGVQADPEPRDFSSSVQSPGSGEPNILGKGIANSKAIGTPNLKRVATEDTATDDPILKNLMEMGYGRTESLQTLERFDYNLDKVSSATASSHYHNYLLTSSLGGRLSELKVMRRIFGLF